MSLDNGKLRKIGGLATRGAGGKVWGYDAGTDSLATVLADDYFLTATDAMAVGDFIEVVHPEGKSLIEVAAIGTTVTTTMTPGNAAGVQTIAAAGAVDVVTSVTLAESAGAAQAMTLADGLFIGQRKTVIHDVDGGSLVLTPATALGFSTATFTGPGETATFMWSGALGWVVVGFGGPTAALPAFA